MTTRSRSWTVGLIALAVDFAAVMATVVLLTLAFPPVGWRWLAHVALVPVMIATVSLHRGAWRMAFTVYVGSFAWWLLTIDWLVPVTGGGYVALAAYMAIYLPTSAVLLRYLGRAYSLPFAVLLPLVWVPLEWARGRLLAGGFGWYALSHSQAPWRPGESPAWLLQAADLGGEHLVSLFVAASNGALVDLLLAWRGRRPRRFVAVAIGWTALLAIASLYGIYRQRPSALAGSARIAVVQTNVPQDNKESPTPRSEVAAWNELVDVTRSAMKVESGVALVVWPESCTPASINAEALDFYRRTADYWAGLAAEKRAPEGGGGYYQWLAAAEGVTLNQVPQLQAQRYTRYVQWARTLGPLARELRVDLAVGALTRQGEVEHAGYNSLFQFQRDGRQVLERYDKIHLVPFGEYVPWISQWPTVKQWFIQYLTPYDHDYTLTPGRRTVVFKTADAAGIPFRWTPAICFEDTVGHLVRRMVHPPGDTKIDLLVSISNDGWFAGTPQGYHHMQIAVLRCIENRVPMARSVNTGPSGFIDATGRIGPLVDVGGRTQDVAGAVAHEVLFDDRRTLFARLGQWPLAILTAILTGLTIGGAFVRGKEG